MRWPILFGLLIAMAACDKLFPLPDSGVPGDASMDSGPPDLAPRPPDLNTAATCNTCAQFYCGIYYQQCAVDTTCMDYVNCYNGCSMDFDPPSCHQRCANDSPSAVGEALEGCVASSCPGLCQ